MCLREDQRLLRRLVFRGGHEFALNKNGIVNVLRALTWFLLFIVAIPGITVSAQTNLPAEIPMNPEAGQGGLLFVTLHLEDGEPLPFVVDTGCPTTCLDESLESRLGKRLRTDTLWSFGMRSQINVYPAPKLYLGKTLLEKAGPLIVTHDCRQMSASVRRPIMGVLGMDVLEHYCVQLDFAAGKVRFLEPGQRGKRKWGTAFPMMNIGDGCMAISNNLTGMAGVGSLIDTGCNYDGWLIPQLYQQWTDPDAPPVAGQSHAPNGILDEQTYANLDLHDVAPKLFYSGDTHIQFNGLGLSFLARYLVTLDFPEHMLYLKRVRSDRAIGPETGVKTEVAAAAKVLRTLEQSGRLPGWSASDDMHNNVHFHLDSGVIIFDLHKNGDPSLYHYTFDHSDGEHWQLTKAWRTDAAGHVAQNYSAP